MVEGGEGGGRLYVPMTHRTMSPEVPASVRNIRAELVDEERLIWTKGKESLIRNLKS